MGVVSPPNARSVRVERRGNARLAGLDQPACDQVSSLPVISNLIHSILEAPHSLFQVLVRQKDVALALVRRVIDRNQQPLAVGSLPPKGEKAVARTVSVPRRNAIEPAPSSEFTSMHALACMGHARLILIDGNKAGARRSLAGRRRVFQQLGQQMFPEFRVAGGTVAARLGRRRDQVEASVLHALDLALHDP